MKKVILLMTHFGADSHYLCRALNEDKRIQWVDKNFIFDHPTTITTMSNSAHKYSNAVGLFLSEIFYNYQISHKGIYKICEFIFLVRSPKYALPEIMKEFKTPEASLDYYIFRLRRMYETAKELKKVILVRKEDLISGEGLKLIKEKLNLSEDIDYKSDPDIQMPFPANLLRKAEQFYELFLYRINSIS
jgi:hypothetical protein